MVSRKNIELRKQQSAKQIPHYGLRRLSIGVASVLLGTSLYLGANSLVASADAVTPGKDGQTDTETHAPATANNQQSSVVQLKTGVQSDNHQAAAVESAQLLNDSKQVAEVKTRVHFTGDDGSATVDVANAHAGDTYQVVFHTDPHLTLDYTPGPLTQQGVVDSKQTVAADGTATYSGKFLKAATINQPSMANL